jgi:hypothetical protein
VQRGLEVLVSELIVAIFAGFAFTYREWVMTSESPIAPDASPVTILSFSMVHTVLNVSTFTRVYTLLMRYR